MKLSSVPKVTIIGDTYGWTFNENYKTYFYGTGPCPLVKTSAGDWLVTLMGFFSSDSYSFTKEYITYYIKLKYLQCQYMVNIEDDTKSNFYIIIHLESELEPNSVERKFFENSNLMLFDTTRNDGAEIKFKPILESQYNDYKFISEIEDKWWEQSYIAEFIGKETIDKTLNENGLFKEIFDLATTSSTDMMLTYNYRIEEI